jgi:hypothetical protein
MAAVFPAGNAKQKKARLYMQTYTRTCVQRLPRATFASGAQQKMQIGPAMLCSTHLSLSLELRRAVSAGQPRDPPRLV